MTFPFAHPFAPPSCTPGRAHSPLWVKKKKLSQYLTRPIHTNAPAQPVRPAPVPTHAVPSRRLVLSLLSVVPPRPFTHTPSVRTTPSIHSRAISRSLARLPSCARPHATPWSWSHRLEHNAAVTHRFRRDAAWWFSLPPTPLRPLCTPGCAHPPCSRRIPTRAICSIWPTHPWCRLVPSVCAVWPTPPRAPVLHPSSCLPSPGHATIRGDDDATRRAQRQR